jgi:hypothetical protein
LAIIACHVVFDSVDEGPLITDLITSTLSFVRLPLLPPNRVDSKMMNDLEIESDSNQGSQRSWFARGCTLDSANITHYIQHLACWPPIKQLLWWIQS